ncbi:MAG: PhoU domain-containing protein [Lysobacterales bacterium]|jgi:phosphate transport system protein
MTQIENRMETHLEQIRGLLWDIGSQAESALYGARKALFERDADLAYRVILDDHPLDRKSRRCDSFCHDFIGRFLPGAGVQREMTATIRINAILERIGDHAVTVCREALRLERSLPAQFCRRIDSIADESLSLLSAARSSFREGDAEQAMSVIHSARQLESRMDSYYAELFSEDERLDATTMMVIFVVFNIYKRVADQAGNICEQAVYTVRGTGPSPDACRILFMAGQDSDLAQEALSIAGAHFAENVSFSASGPEISASDLGETTVVVGLNRPVSDFVSTVPFHTTVQNWTIPPGADEAERRNFMLERLTDLVERISGNPDRSDR